MVFGHVFTAISEMVEVGMMINFVLAGSWFEQIVNFFNQLISGFQFVVDHFVSMGKAVAKVFTVIPSALALPGYISSAVPPIIITVASIGMTVAIIGIVLPGLGGKK